MSTILRFTTIDRAALNFIGNTLGLLGTFNPSQASTSISADGIGTFTTTNPLLISPGGYPLGTTQDFTLNSSSAILSLPPNSTILYAELIWSGTYGNALQNVLSNINDSVNFTSPKGITTPISPDPITSQQFNNLFYKVDIYARTANVTSLVQDNGVGTYTLSKVPCALGGNNSTSPGTIESNFLGWTLAVVYKNPTLPYRSINIWTLFQGIRSNSPMDVPISGFITPSIGSLYGRLAISAGSGDCYISGDEIKFGSSPSSLTSLSGPNNNINNFFCSQINDSDSESPTVGQLNTTGTFGTRNAPIGSKLIACRHGWDITNIDISSTLKYNQNSALIKFSSTNDVYYPNVLGLQIDVDSANLFPIIKYVDKEYAPIGDTLTYTISFKNSGSSTASNVIFITTVPNNTIFINNSFTVNNSIIPNINSYISTIPLGSIQPNESVTLSYKIKVSSSPLSGSIHSVSGVIYSFLSNDKTSSTYTSTNSVLTTIPNFNLNLTGYVDKFFATCGDILNYTITIINTTNITAHNVQFIDSISNEIQFVDESLYINSLNYIKDNPLLGITLPDMLPSSTTTINFKAKVCC